MLSLSWLGPGTVKGMTLSKIKINLDLEMK